MLGRYKIKESRNEEHYPEVSYRRLGGFDIWCRRGDRSGALLRARLARRLVRRLARQLLGPLLGLGLRVP
jgi:hypothetical protein